MTNVPTQTADDLAGSLLSIDIRPRGRSQETRAASRSDRFIHAWENLRGDGEAVGENQVDPATLGSLWDECFRVDYCAEREDYVVSPIGHLPEPVKSRINGPHAMAMLIHWINHIATANANTGEPIVRRGMLDLGSGPMEWELTLVPLLNARTGRTDFLGILGN